MDSMIVDAYETSQTVRVDIKVIIDFEVVFDVIYNVILDTL